MDRHYATAEQYQRWFIHDCARCGRRGNSAGRWPDGHVCRTCHDRALRVTGVCPGCGHDRVLPGLRSVDGATICTTCAGFTPSFTCSRCGREGKLHRGRLCTRCTLTDQISALLDDGTGRTRAGLEPLAELLTTMPNPLTGLTWLYSRPGRLGSPADLLRGLGQGDIELTHEAFHQLQPWRAAAHLRELLMKCGLLPTVDKHVLLFERWLAEHLEAITNAGHRRLIRQYATWQVLPWIRNRASRGPLTNATRGTAGGRISRATEFLTWLDARQLTIEDLDQGHLDEWLVNHRSHHRLALKPFLAWVARNGRTAVLNISAHRGKPKTPITQHRRITLLRRLLTDDVTPLRTRAAAILLLLYAQPLTRILRLTTEDLTSIDGETYLRFGDPLTPVPEPVAEVLLALRDQRTNMRTATNADARWLFPGRRAGQPLTTATIAPLIRKLGVPSVPGRLAALRQLVLQAPAPVIAQALGFHHHTAQRAHVNAGGTWNRYTSTEHPR